MQASTAIAGATILLVDDNVANLGVLTQLLTAQGVRVLVAQQGESGIQIAQRTQPELILLDVQLPGLDGFATCRRLQAEASTAAIPVLFMTARTEAADKLKGFAAGGVDYITKPFQEEEVLARVRAHLRLRQLTHHLQAQNIQLQDAQASLRTANAELERRVAERTAELVKANADEQRARRLAETLSAANLALTQTLDLDTILDTLLEYLKQLVPYDSASAMVYEADARLVVRSVRGAARWGDVQLTLNLVLDVATSPHLHALLSTQASIMSADTATSPLHDQHGGAAGAHSWLGVPLIAGGMVIGVYTLDKHESGFFTEEHRQVAESLAAQAAVAMQNARLFAEVSAARTRLQAVSRQLVAVQEAERAQIARDLHDEIGQMLTALKLVLAIGSRSTPELVQARLAEAQLLVNDLTTRVRQLSLDLRPAMLDDLGLLPTILWYTKRYMQQTEIQVTLKHTGLEQRVASDLEIAVYRIVQEGLTNVARHSGVHEVTIRLWRTQEFIGVRIEDQGHGFLPEQVLTAYTSSGLAGMVERVRLLRGQLTIESAPGQGTRLIAELPLGDSFT
jgi:signal transduction histidine kinase/FixJ family two-component response regulator